MRTGCFILSAFCTSLITCMSPGNYLSPDIVYTPQRYSDNRVLFVQDAGLDTTTFSQELIRKEIADFRRLRTVESLQSEYARKLRRLNGRIDAAEILKEYEGEVLRKAAQQMKSSIEGSIQSSNSTAVLDLLEDRKKFVEDVLKAPPSDFAQLLSNLKAERATFESVMIQNGSPLSVVLRTVGVPRDAGDRLLIPNKKELDIAVLLDISTNSDAPVDTMVVWFQRGVKPGQTLNFSNILVYYEAAWDYRYPPSFRIRLVNVADVENKEIGEILSTISSSVGSVAAVVKNPLISPLVQSAMTGAKLILSHAENKVLVDYTVQFYSSEFVQASDDIGITGLRSGSFIVVGQPAKFDGEKCFPEKDNFRSFWDNRLYYKSFSGDVYFSSCSTADSLNKADSPFLTLNVTPAESILPKAVIERSIRLNQMLASYNSGSRLSDISELGNKLADSIMVYTATEKAKRYQRVSDIADALELAKDASLADEDKLVILKWLNSKCKTNLSIAQYLEGLTAKTDRSRVYECPR